MTSYQRLLFLSFLIYFTLLFVYYKVLRFDSFSSHSDDYLVSILQKIIIRFFLLFLLQIFHMSLPQYDAYLIAVSMKSMQQ